MLTSQNARQPPNQLTVTLVLSKSQCVHQFEGNCCSTNEINLGHLIKVDKLQAGHFCHSAHLEISQAEKLLLTPGYELKVSLQVKNGEELNQGLAQIPWPFLCVPPAKSRCFASGRN